MIIVEVRGFEGVDSNALVNALFKLACYLPGIKSQYDYHGLKN